MPDVDKNGEPSPRRTTPLHHAFQQDENLFHTGVLGKHFDIYDRYDVNYTDEFGITHFHVACRPGLNGIEKNFFELSQVDPNCLVPETGDSPLYFDLLLKGGAKPNAVNTEEVTPLHNIFKHRYNNVELPKMSFEIEKYHPVQVNAQEKSGKTPLHFALFYGYRCTIDLLLKKGADPNIADKEGLTPLHFICSKYRLNTDLVEAVDIFFRINDEIQQTVQINAQDKSGRTALHHALFGRNDSMVELLLRRGVDPNLANAKGLTPLHCICNKPGSALELAELFFRINNEIQQTVQVDAQDKLGQTALHYALLIRNKTVVELLLRRGADPNLAKKNGSTPLHIICEGKYDNDELAKMLFELSDEKYQPVQIDARNKLGNTPLHLALNKGHKKVVELLLREGSDPHLTNAEGLTSFHIICKLYSDDDMAKILFEICDERHQTLLVDILDKEGRTPLQLAVTSLKPDMVDLLLVHGADLSNFVFPTNADFYKYVKIPNPRRTIESKLKVTSGILGVIENLQKGGVVLDLSNVLLTMLFLAADGFFEMKVKFDKCWLEDVNFASESKKLMITPNMSFYDFVRLSPEKADRRLTCADYFRFLQKHYNQKELRNHFLPEGSIIQTCAVYLCEKLVRRFFLSWALYCFMELIRKRLPILCCKMIIDNLMNRDLYKICVAMNGQSS